MSIKYKTKDFYKCDNQLIFATVTEKLYCLYEYENIANSTVIQNLVNL